MTTATVAADWKDGKRVWWLLGVLTMALPGMAAALHLWTGSAWAWWFGPLFAFGFIPLADRLLGEDTSNPPESAVAGLENERYYRWAIYAAVVVQYAGLVLACWIVTRWNLAWHEILGLAITTGVSSGIAINTGHELGHKTDPAERWLAKIALAPTAYGHFFVEHNRGHHVRVATPEDAASSRYGESFWAFLPRTVIGSLRSAWHLEGERMARNGLPVWHWKNDNLQAWAMTVLLWAGLVAAFGWMLLPFLVVQAVYGFSLLEVVNYLEHYGLLRQKLPNGRYERCQPRHSWNSNSVVTNIFLYQLQRHSDHHANPTRSYQSLRHFDESPQLPAGYATMIVAAYFPPLWFRIMNRRVEAYFKGDLSQANVAPKLQARLQSA